MLLLAGDAFPQVSKTGPSAGRILWLRGDRSVSAGISNLVELWSDPTTGNELAPVFPAQSPELRRFGLAGRPALRFDGNDRLQRSNSMPVGDYTKVVVFQLEDYGSENDLVSGNTGHALSLGFSDRVSLAHGTPFVTSSLPTLLGQPTVVVATYEASTGKGRLYQDGQFAGGGNAPPHSDDDIRVGGFGSSSNLRGLVAEVAIYDRVLPKAERRLLERRLLRQYRDNQEPAVLVHASPRPGQLIARDPTDLGHTLIRGDVLSTGYDGVVLESYEDGVLDSTQSKPLQYTTGFASFSFSPSIVAGLHDWELRVLLERGGVRTEVHRVENLSCGDLFLVMGQSNAVAGDYWNEGLGNQHQSPWIRTFGTMALTDDILYDLHWDIADGEVLYDHAGVGQWALRMAEEIVLDQQIPVGLVNAAVGATSSDEHLRNVADPDNIFTLYGRLLYRCVQAGIDDDVRAMLWYQGESDQDDGAGWAANFASLRASWAQDYPGLEQIFLFQIHEGCGGEHGGVMEAQRQLVLDPGVTLMSSTATAHDGCHFFHAGYEELGTRLARVVARDLYGSTDTQDIDPPDVLSAEWVDAGRDQVRLRFRDPDDSLSFDAGAELYFELDDGTPATGATVIGNTLIVDLAAPSSASTISWVGHRLAGPSITNARGVGILTFHGVLIQ